MKNKQIHVRFSEGEHKLLRIICIHKGISIQDLTHNLINKFLNENKKCLSSLITIDDNEP